MKIAIYDTRHYEMVYVLFRIFDIPENEIIFLVSRKVNDKLNASAAKLLNRHPVIVQEETENSKDYFTSCTEELKKFNPDFLLLNTIDKDYKDVSNFLKSVSIPYIITVHNINTWLNPPFTLNRLALKNYFYRKKIVKGSSMLVVQEELFVQYVINKKLYKKPVITIPHTLREEKPVKTNNEKIVIIIPGGIDGVRRDNDLSLDVIEEINKKSNRFQFVFAGKVIGHLGEKIWNRVISLQKKGLDIQHFYDESSNHLFDEQMKNCNVVFLPLNVKTKYEGIPEIYGTTKVTGVIYDMMRFCKPGISPAEMIVPPTMKGSILCYQDKKELVELFLSLASDKSLLEKLKTKAEENSLYYTAENIRKRIFPVLKQKLPGK